MKSYLNEDTLTIEKEEYWRHQSNLDSMVAMGLNTTLNEYQPNDEMPWDRRRVAHLLRRTGYGAHIDSIKSYGALPPSEAVDKIILDAQNAPMPETPSWINETPPSPFTGEYSLANRERSREYEIAWTDEMRKYPFRERMTFFWRNHFVVSSNNDIFAPLWHRYLTVLRTHAFGNFKEFCKAIGLDHAMLIYLDGGKNSNNNEQPQENYAREFLELFTMGIKNKNDEFNYTQDDITQLAKAFSGYSIRLRPEFKVTFDPDDFYDEVKNILGRTGNFDYHEAIDVVFEERPDEIAYHICKKIYRYFIYEGVNETIVEDMANIFIASDFEILPVVRALLKSEHFFDDEFIGSKIKSPLEFLNGLYVETGAEPDQNLKEDHGRWLDDLGQDPYDAPNVAGWPGYRLWLDNTTITRRWSISNSTISRESQDYNLDVVELSKKIAGDEVNDAEKLAQHLLHYFINVPLPEDETTDLAALLLDGVPGYAWDVDADGADENIRAFIEYLRELPEYNLF